MDSSEIIIRKELQETGSPWQAALNLIGSYEEQPENYDHEYVESLAQFLFHCGFYKTLYDFILKHLTENYFKIPWTYFLETLAKFSSSLEKDALVFIKRAILLQKSKDQASKAHSFNKFMPEITSWNQQRRQTILDQHEKLKKEALIEARALQRQGLYESEKNELYKALSLFPGDQEILSEIKLFNERHAYELLQKKSRPKTELQKLTESEKNPTEEQMSPLRNGLKIASQTHSELCYDLAVAAFTLEQFDLAEEILQKAKASPEKTWFLLEVFLKEEKYLEVLTLLSQARLESSRDPDSPYALHYIEAQALWGLGQKEKARHLLENLLIAKPNYRFAESLLYLWRTEG